MIRVIVYPNNSVNVDGVFKSWGTNVLTQFGIKTHRICNQGALLENGETFIIGQYHFTVFPTHQLASRYGRFSYRGQILRHKYGKDYFKNKRKGQ